jgi:hypothetical protein
MQKGGEQFPLSPREAPLFGIGAKPLKQQAIGLTCRENILQASGLLEAGGLHNLIRSLRPPMSERAVGAKRSTLDDPVMCTEPEKEMVADSGKINLGSWMFLELRSLNKYRATSSFCLECFLAADIIISQSTQDEE